MKELYSRNAGIFDDAERERINHTRLTIFGCGLGSVIAELALRSGFVHMTVVDGDTVDVTNLNRQMFTLSDVGTYKAEALAKRLKEINPEADIVFINKYVSSNETWHHDLIRNSDVVIDTIDISSIRAMLDIHRTARANDKPIIFPLNMAYSGGVFVFTSASASLESMLRVSEDIDLEAAEELYINKSIFMKWVDMCQPYMNEHNIAIMKRFIGRVATEGWCPLPQLGIAAYTSATLSVTLLTKLVSGIDFAVAPYMHISDPWDV